MRWSAQRPAMRVPMLLLRGDECLVLLRLRPKCGKEKAQRMSRYGESNLAVWRIARQVAHAEKRGHEISRGSIAQPAHGLELGASKFGLCDKEVVQRDER